MPITYPTILVPAPCVKARSANEFVEIATYWEKDPSAPCGVSPFLFGSDHYVISIQNKRAFSKHYPASPDTKDVIAYVASTFEGVNTALKYADTVFPGKRGSQEWANLVMDTLDALPVDVSIAWDICKALYGAPPVALEMEDIARLAHPDGWTVRARQ